MLIAHFSLYMKCFTKPLIGATLLAVWIFSFGWLVGHFYENWRVTPLRRNFRCRRCCRCGAPWGKIRTLSLARSSVTPGAGAASVNSDGDIILLYLQIAQNVSLPAWIHTSLPRDHHLLLGHLLQSAHQSASGCAI